MSGMRCQRCDRENPPGANFCGTCGARLATFGPRGAPLEVYAFEQFTETPGERKQITVLFADVKSSMELMLESVNRYEGTTVRVAGDGIMALFGAPFAHEDHGIRGCYAALRMQEAVKRYAHEIQRTHGVPIQ